MTFILWDQINGFWTRTPQNRYVENGTLMIDSQFYASQSWWLMLQSYGIYEERIIPGPAPLGYNTPVIALDGEREYADRYPTGTDAERNAQTRKDLANEISVQITQPTQAESVIDPGVNDDVVRTSSAASDKQIELDATADIDLIAFDTTIETATPQADVGYSRLSVIIEKQTPWAGAPDNDLGFTAILEVEEEYADQAAEARLYVVDAPSDVGAVLPFVQDATYLNIWACRTRDGHMWAAPETSCTVHLLWGAGASVISPDLTCEELYDRSVATIRYGVPA